MIRQTILEVTVTLFSLLLNVLAWFSMYIYRVFQHCLLLIYRPVKPNCFTPYEVIIIVLSQFLSSDFIMCSSHAVSPHIVPCPSTDFT